MATTVVTGLIAVLFLVVAALLGYGAYTFTRRHETQQPARVNMAREVLWTGLGSLLLFGLFLYAHP